MKDLWQLPQALMALMEKRFGRERRTGDRRRGASALFRLFGKTDRRQTNRRRATRRHSSTRSNL